MPTLCPKLCELQANVLIRGVVMLDIGWVVPNWITWLIQTWKFDVLRNYQHSYMLFLCILHIKSTVSYIYMGGGPRVVVSTAAFHARVRGSVPGLGGLKETKNVSSPSTCES